MMMSLSPPTLSVFSCYAQEDAALREQFEKHLATLKQRGWIHSWSDRDIGAGAEWQRVIDHHLHTADLLLLFVSADFINSEYGYGTQMQEALRRHRAGEAIVIPILLRSVEWKQTSFGTLQALPRDGRAVTSWSNQDEAFRQIAQEIGVVVEFIRHPVVIVPCLPDRLFSERLARDLTAHGIPIIEAETTQEPAILKEHIREASAVVVITSPGTEHTRAFKEVESFAEMYQRPVIGVWISEEEQDEGPDASPQPFHRHEWIVVDPGQEQSTLQVLRASVQKKRFHGLGLSLRPPQEEPTISKEPRNPYKGLDAFTAADVGDFFGRTALVDSLVACVETILSLEKKGHQPARLLAVVGASGSGKSSVVQAGLLPALQAGRIFESDTWVYLDPIIPGEHPLEGLAHTLFEHFPENSLEMIEGDVHNASLSSLHLYATTIARRRGSKHVVLVVDQFEEVFTLTENEQERQQFLDLLVTACTKRDGPLIVVLTLRGDFYDRLMQYPALYQLVVEHLTPMLPMTLPDLRAVITQPARLPDVQVTFEGNLVGDLLFDVQGQIGALPLLQFTLEQLFEQRERHLLTEYAYQEMGSIRGALAKHAEEWYLALPSAEHRELARTLFLRLLDPGTTEQETTRRRATLTEFEFADRRKTRSMRGTIDTFVKARLLTTTTNERTGTTTIEVSHETLIREWPRLVNWLREARDDIYLQQNISRDAAMWEHNTRSGDRLYRGTELKEAQAWAKRNLVSNQEQAFLKASAARRLLTMIVVFLFVVTSSGIATWVVLSQPHPDYVTKADNDGSAGSLRWAIANAPSGSTITFAQNVRKLIELTGGDLVVGGGKQLTIIGPGASQLAISGGNLNAHIHVPKGAMLHISDLSFKGSKTVAHGFLYNEGSLTVTGSVIANNQTTADVSNLGVPNGLGGGIFNSGTLAVINSTISGNGVKTGFGGGIFNSGTLTLIHSTVSGNMADYDDGGIGNDLKGTLILTNSTISHNTSRNNGGIGNDGTLTLTNSTISDNTSRNNGGIGNDGTLILTNSTISHNTASISGGGISNVLKGTLTLTNSTISDNSASISGGGIFNQSSTQTSPFIAQADLTFSTIYGNRASVGSDIAVQDVASNGQLSRVKISNSIIAGDPIRLGPDISGTLISFGYNLFQNTSGATFDSATRELDGTDKILSVNDLGKLFAAPVELRNNGGPTMTYMLGSSSPAIDAIPLQYCQVQGILNKQPRMYIDQRGMKRPDGNERFCDIGAYEYQVSP